ncbi:MAG: succinate dehydrogenase, cytochrome b556 subunit [Acidiferrobacterales bacterium]
MGKSQPRPVFLNLFVIRLPISGIISIVHRISGVLLVLLTPAAIYSFGLSLENPEQFARVQAWFGSVSGKLVLLFMVAVFVQHLFSGLRHLAMDIDWGVDLQTARLSAWGTLVATVAVLGILVLRWLT